MDDQRDLAEEAANKRILDSGDGEFTIHTNDDGDEELILHDAIGIRCDVGLVRDRGIVHVMLYDGAGPPMEAAIELDHLEAAVALLRKGG